MEPYSMIVAPADIYLAPVGESVPDVDNTPSGNWEKLGTNAADDYSEDGVTLTFSQTINTFRGLGTTAPRKAVRAEEDLTISGVLEDMTLEEFAKILNDVTVSDGTTSGSGASTKEITLHQGRSVSTFALLLRYPSPYGEWNQQTHIPKVFQNASPAPAFTKDGKAGLAFEFMALEDPNAATDAEKFGTTVAQDGAAP